MKNGLVFGMLIVTIAAVGIATLTTAAYAIGDNRSCRQTQSGVATDSCSGNSAKSPNKDVVNPGVHAPAGQNRRKKQLKKFI
jgi:hypothetical protein